MGPTTARMFILFKAPPEKDLEWDDADVEGQFRFLNRVWRLAADFLQERGAPGKSGVPPLPATLSKDEKDPASSHSYRDTSGYRKTLRAD